MLHKRDINSKLYYVHILYIGRIKETNVIFRFVPCFLKYFLVCLDIMFYTMVFSLHHTKKTFFTM